MLVAGKKASARGLLLGLSAGLLAWLLFRTFVVSLVWVPSSSMEPAILASELVAASPRGLKLGGQSGEPLRRGDIVIFRSEVAPFNLVIKRVVGLAGDLVEVDSQNGLRVNGNWVTRQGDEGAPTQDGVLTELIDGQEWRVHWRLPTEAWSLSVPEGSFVVLGDNRDNSVDSRVWGSVSQDRLVAFPKYILWSCEGADSKGRMCGLANLRRWRLGPMSSSSLEGEL